MSNKVVTQPFPKHSEFKYNEDIYTVDFSDPEEVRMAYYLRKVVVLKNSSNFIPLDWQEDPHTLNITSRNIRFMFLPFIDKPQVFDLEIAKSYEIDMPFVRINQFDTTNRFLLVCNYHEYQIIDLNTGKSVWNYKDEELDISGLRLSIDNKVWTIHYSRRDCFVKRFDLSTWKEDIDSIPSPFDFFGIDANKYSVLTEKEAYNLSVPEGGMLTSRRLNKWTYINTGDRAIYKTALPVSDISYNEFYKRPSCKVDYFFVEIVDQ